MYSTLEVAQVDYNAVNFTDCTNATEQVGILRRRITKQSICVEVSND